MFAEGPSEPIEIFNIMIHCGGNKNYLKKYFCYKIIDNNKWGGWDLFSTAYKSREVSYLFIIFCLTPVDVAQVPQNGPSGLLWDKLNVLS